MAMSHGVQEADLSVLLLKSALRSALGMLRSCAEAWGSALSEREAVALRELQNKLEVFERFQYALAEIGGFPLPLPETVRRAAALEPWSRLWVTEGVGHALADAAWRGPVPLRGLLASLPARGVPVEAWIPLHTGMGLSLAANVLREHGSPAQAPDAVRLLLDLCERCSVPGYTRAAFEGLGFVARNLFSRAVPALDLQLARLAPELRACFWHGVGRGLYFSPTGFLPGSTAAAMDRALGEPPYEEGRRNTVAGAVWALTLVNFRHPEILAAFLSGQPRLCRPPLEGALADGISSAVAVWYDASGADRWLTSFLRYRPDGAGAAAVWQRLVERPCRSALRRHAGLRRGRRLEDLFHYRPNGGPPR